MPRQVKGTFNFTIPIFIFQWHFRHSQGRLRLRAHRPRDGSADGSQLRVQANFPLSKYSEGVGVIEEARTHKRTPPDSVPITCEKIKDKIPPFRGRLLSFL
jgi:hypothetical protein